MEKEEKVTKEKPFAVSTLVTFLFFASVNTNVFISNSLIKSGIENYISLLN